MISGQLSPPYLGPGISGDTGSHSELLVYYTKVKSCYTAVRFPLVLLAAIPEVLPELIESEALPWLIEVIILFILPFHIKHFEAKAGSYFLYNRFPCNATSHCFRIHLLQGSKPHDTPFMII